MHCLVVSMAVLALPSICLGGPGVIPVRSLTAPVLLPVENVLPKPYEFGFEFGDGLGMTQHRREVADGTGRVKGSYGYLDHLGVSRTVDYSADSDGYKAAIRSNEPGMAAQNSANVVYVVQPPPPYVIAQGQRKLPAIAI